MVIQNYFIKEITDIYFFGLKKEPLKIPKHYFGSIF